MTDAETVDHRDETIARLIRSAGMTGLRGRIDAMCCSCIYDPIARGTWRKQVQDCTSASCPLYDVRPTSNYAEEDAPQVAELETE
jgi:hypothetical protein